MPFLCSICGEESTRICVRCTKDACNNHLCEKCLRCSDCCECEIALSDEAQGPPLGSARAAIRAAAESRQVADVEMAGFPESLPEPPPAYTPQPYIPSPEPPPAPAPTPEPDPTPEPAPTPEPEPNPDVPENPEPLPPGPFDV